MSATCTVRSSRFSGRVCSRLCIWARLSIWNTPMVSASWISAYTAGSSNPMRDRSGARPCPSAMRSRHSSTALSMPRPSRSIFTNPASAQESLSHWQMRLPSMAAGTTGTSSTNGVALTTMPPECWVRCRGSPAASRASDASARQRRDFRRSSPPGMRRISSSTASADDQPSDSRASRSMSAGGRASAVPSSRMAMRARKVGKAPTSAACSSP